LRKADKKSNAKSILNNERTGGGLAAIEVVDKQIFLFNYTSKLNFTWSYIISGCGKKKDGE